MQSAFEAPAERWGREAYDPPKVSWQTDALYHVEHARRMLKEARRQAREVIELRESYDAQRALEQQRVRAREEWRELELRRQQEADVKRKERLKRWGTHKLRNRWVYEQRLAGRTLREIGGEAGIGRERVRQICWKEERLDARAKWRMMKGWLRPQNKGRPIDLDAAGGCDGPRDIWLTYLPPADPRLDNMEPVR